jgi:hypothetical protein
MADWTDEWNVAYGRPRGSVELPVHESFDLKVWSRGIAEGVLGPGASRKQVRTLATALAEATLDARARDPLSAVFFCPEPELGELARIEVTGYLPDATYPEITVERLGEWLASPTERSVQPAEVMYTELPAGPAVRVRHQYVEAAGDGDGLGSVVQTCAWAVRPPQIDSAVVMTVSWQALAWSERLFELTDKLAGMLRLEHR